MFVYIHTYVWVCLYTYIHACIHTYGGTEHLGVCHDGRPGEERAELRRQVAANGNALAKAMASSPDAKGGCDTHTQGCFGLRVSNLQHVATGDRFDVLDQVHVADSEVPVRPAFPRPIAHVLCNC
jgi:hypothetical protein